MGPPFTAGPGLGMGAGIIVGCRPTQSEDSTSTRSSRRGRRPAQSIESIPSRLGGPILTVRTTKTYAHRSPVSVDRDIAAGHGRHRAIIDATVRRARPVVLTALAAILGMIPLAGSILWGPMAITIMGGLLVATALTLLVVPALYALWFRVRSEDTVDLPSFHPQRLEAFDAELDHIRIAA
jgi:hypothetical protein